jgi:hypothetical protein
MPRNAEVLTVFLAHPSDVSEESQRVREGVEDCNRTVGNLFGARLEFRSRETDSAPGYHPAGPQARIAEAHLAPATTAIADPVSLVASPDFCQAPVTCTLELVAGQLKK